MKEKIMKLKECGNLLEKLLNPRSRIWIIRVFGYESVTIDNYYSAEIDSQDFCDEEQKLMDVFKMIRDEVRKLNWSDNKIVVEIKLSELSYNWHVFIGYFDFTVSIGGGVCPNMYPAKYKLGPFGRIEPIKIR